MEGERHTALIVADLTCLTCSLVVLSAVFRRSAEEGWAIISLGPTRIDTTRPEGRVLQAVLGFYDTLGTRDEDVPVGTKAAQDPNEDQPSPKERIVWERIAGASLGQIANGLNRDGIAVPGKQGNWLPSAVWAELETCRPVGNS